MKYEEILKKVDHTLLKQEATWEQIQAICDDAMAFSTASVCIPPSYVKQVRKYMDACSQAGNEADRVKVCTVIGFPNGYHSTAVKLAEAKEAVADGADEIDTVINIGWVKDGRYDLILEELKQMKQENKDAVLKVIIETCLLTEEEKIKMCQVVTESGADFIKTSTGFSTGGATFEDIALFKAHVGEGVKIKAAGGIATMEDAKKFIELGADRLGTSRVVALVKKENPSEAY